MLQMHLTLVPWGSRSEALKNDCLRTGVWFGIIVGVLCLVGTVSVWVVRQVTVARGSLSSLNSIRR